MTRSSTPIVDSPRFHDLVPSGYRAEKLADGFAFIEGPLWDARAGALQFSDIVGDVIRRWDEEGVTEWRRPANMPNGATYDAAGNLLICEHVPPGVRRIAPDGTETVIASQWEGKDLNSPNDVVCRSDGSVYFTDPPSGRTAEWGVERPQDLDFQGVFLVRPSGELVLLADDYEIPNGLCLSPDERTLYVNDTHRCHIRAYDVAPDGGVSNEQILLEGITTEDMWDGVPDGLKVDVEGNLYCSGPHGVWVISPQGERLGVISMPEFISNFNWGGPDYDALYLCGFKTLYRVQLAVSGHGIPQGLGAA